MSLLPQQLARADGASVELRPEPLRVNWNFEDIVTGDSHALRVRFACSVQVADTTADRRMFREVFLGTRSHVMAEDVVTHFSARLRKAAANVAAQHPADAWVGEKSSELQAALVQAGKSVAFASGLEILPPFNIEIDSPSLRRQRLEEMERARAEERVAGQVQHFQRAAELLAQFQSLREQMPDLSPSELLQQVNPVDRGSTLQSLLMANAKQAPPQQSLWAVAGPRLVRIDARHSPPQLDLIALPTALGPLRSVQPATINGRRMLLIGARSGVMVLSPDSPTDAQLYTDPTVESQLGFNRVVAREGEVWASHGEAGVVGWKLGETSEPFARFGATTTRSDVNENDADNGPPPLPVSPPTAVISMGGSPSLITAAGSSRSGPRLQGPRNLHVIDEQHLIYSVGHEPVVLGPHAAEPQALPAESTTEIVAILPAGERTLLIVHADSTVAVFSRQTRQIEGRQRRAGRVCAAGALPWLGGVRLLLVDTDGPIDCVGFDDPLITQYVSPHRGLRVITASEEFVAAISSDRQRIILWQTWDGRAPLDEVHVTGVARHRVADVEFG